MGACFCRQIWRGNYLSLLKNALVTRLFVIRLLNLPNKKSPHAPSLLNLSASVVETVICRQNSQLYGMKKETATLKTNEYEM